MLLPSPNTVAEGELAAMLPVGVSLHTTRLKLTGGRREDFLDMAASAEAGAELLADANVDLIVFHCTAVTTLDPDLEHGIRERIEQRSGKPATTTAKALLAALKALDASRAVLITPYEKEVNKREIAFLSQFGVTVIREFGSELVNGAAIAAVDPQEWYHHAKSNRDDQAQAYILSCTAIRTASIIDILERDLGKPVLTSNQAMLWHALRLGGVPDKIRGLGRLLATH
jgi:maleate isomerase